MKSSKAVFSLVATAGVLASFNVQAAAPARAAHPHPGKVATPGVHTRELNQSARINQGVRSGDLTQYEATQLRGEEKAIRDETKAYRADGVVTAAERKDLQQDLSQTSKDIYQQKHDGQFRNPSPPPIPSPEDIAKARRARKANAAATVKVGGEAAPPEASGARVEAQQLRADVREFRADGQLSQEERLKIREDLRALRQR